MTTEARITINRSPDAPRKEGRLNPARQANEAVGEQIRRRRKKIHDQARIDAAVTEQQQEAAKTAEPPPPREDIDSIEVPLRNGLKIEYGPPNGISLLDRIARFYGGRDPSVSEFRLTRVLMGVREINGKPVPPLTNEVERTRLANRIGDEGIDLLFYYDRTYWPPLRQTELPSIKKDLEHNPPTASSSGPARFRLLGRSLFLFGRREDRAVPREQADRGLDDRLVHRRGNAAAERVTIAGSNGEPPIFEKLLPV